MMGKERIEKRLRSQDGYALVTVLVLLVALGFVGGAAAIMTASDTRVSGLLTFSNRAGAAAQAGLEHATAHFVTNGAGTGWPVTGSVNAYAYTVAIQADSFDFDGVGGPEPVSWSTSAGLNGTGNGEAVWVLTSTASRGSVRATQQLRITGQKLDIHTEAAFSANSGITLRGNIVISGLNHTSAGVPVDPLDTAYNGQCNQNKPAILLTDSLESVNSQGSVTLLGNATFVSSSPPFVKYGSTTVWHSPEEVVGLPEGALDSYKQSGAQYDANRPDSVSGVIYVTDDFGSGGAGGSTLNGTGVLIVHNPLFNPREHDPADPLYDAAKANDPKYAPANLGNINGGTFRGLVIADKVDKIDGNVRIYGSVVSLTEVDVNIVGAGTAQILYSCEVLQTISNSIVAPRRLAWVAE